MRAMRRPALVAALALAAALLPAFPGERSKTRRAQRQRSARTSEKVPAIAREVLDLAGEEGIGQGVERDAEGGAEPKPAFEAEAEGAARDQEQRADDPDQSKKREASVAEVPDEPSGPGGAQAEALSETSDGSEAEGGADTPSAGLLEEWATDPVAKAAPEPEVDQPGTPPHASEHGLGLAQLARGFRRFYSLSGTGGRRRKSMGAKGKKDKKDKKDKEDADEEKKDKEDKEDDDKETDVDQPGTPPNASEPGLGLAQLARGGGRRRKSLGAKGKKDKKDKKDKEDADEEKKDKDDKEDDDKETEVDQPGTPPNASEPGLGLAQLARGFRRFHSLSGTGGHQRRRLEREPETEAEPETGTESEESPPPETEPEETESEER